MGSQCVLTKNLQLLRTETRLPQIWRLRETTTRWNFCVLHEKVTAKGRQEIPRLMAKRSVISAGPVFVL
jgi:hypothetical protein